VSWQDNIFELDADDAQAEGDGVLPLFERQPDRQDRLIPLINIVFLLLAFMLIAGTMRAADTLDVEPPETAAVGTVDRESLMLYLDSSGNLALGKDRVAIDEAISRVKVQLARDPDGELHIMADRSVTAARILPLLRKCADAEIMSVRLIAVRRGQKQ
jgi:biopolymer transport protein ExbD